MILIFVNYLIIIFTLGIGTGIAINRAMRKAFDNIEFENEIDVELKDNQLTVKGEKAKTEDVPEIKYLHKGLSARNFTRTFTLNENVEVRAATIENGVLAIALELVVPEEDQPKKIAITYKK